MTPQRHSTERGNVRPKPPSATGSSRSAVTRYGRVLVCVLAVDFLWMVFSALVQKKSGLSNEGVSLLSVALVVAAWVVLYRKDLQEKRRAARLGIALLTAVTLFGLALMMAVGALLCFLYLSRW